MPAEHAQCPICRAEISPGEGFCGACGSKLDDTPVLEIRSLNYLLSELSRWETDGTLNGEQARSLRESYEGRREKLRAQLFNGRKQPGPSAPATSPPHGAKTPPPVYEEPPPKSSARAPVAKRRALLETLADPHTIRLLLYTGAAMLVVGVVIWLRDILYLKLQEPIVQATLLIIGTAALTVSGWLTILRTRLRLTGRALTLTGSLLVPVNFWFLVRSGLIESSGRAWLVCAFCAVLYGLTAATLRERLYVYLASIAAVTTAWAIIYRIESQALGLYALALMASSLIFLHLSRLFLSRPQGNRSRTDNPQSEIRIPQSNELWGLPLAYVALTGVTLCLFFYMPLRMGSSPSFSDGLLRLRSHHYDSSIAMLLFFMGAYAAWFTGRHLFTERRVLLYTMSALCLFWAEFLALDGLMLSGAVEVLLLAATALIVALAARALKDDVYPLALHRASLVASIVLAPVAFALLADALSLNITHSAILALLAASYAVLSAARLSGGVASTILAYASAVFASIAFMVALGWLNLRSETLFYTACALWPFALYSVAQLTAHMRRETQLTVPFTQIADVEFGLLLLFAILSAFALSQPSEERFLAVENLRGAVLCVLTAAIIYGALRCWRGRSFFGAAIIPLALLFEALIILQIDARWFATASALALFPYFFAMSRYAVARSLDWLAQPSAVGAEAVLGLAGVSSLVQAFFHLRVGDVMLLAPCVAFGAVSLLAFSASLRVKGQARVKYFRAGLLTLILMFALAALRAGYDPLGDVEIYTSPVGLLLLVVAYLFARRERDEYSADTSLLLWCGSLLLAGPLLMHALQYRLFLDVPAPWRDLASLCASLALIVFGVVGRLRAPVLAGATALGLELIALALTSVDWLQIPLKVYLISTGALILLTWGLLEFRREQILLMRKRFNERRETARERFGEWK
jgi:hypothetical protein